MASSMRRFDGVFPGDAGGEMLDVAIADVTLTYPQNQPEAEGAMVEAYRTGRQVTFVQDLNALASENVNLLNAVYNRNYNPQTRQPVEMVYANVALIGVNLAGLE